MSEVTISSKFQVVIPSEVRRSLSLRAGQKMQVLVKGNTIVIVPILPLEKMRGMLRGMEIGSIREEEDRL